MSSDDRSEPKPAQSVAHAPGEGRQIALGDAGVVTLKVVRGDSGGTLSAYDFVLLPTTAGPPLHLHRGWDELFYVLEREMTFLIDGRRSSAPAGSCVFVPRGVLHTFWNEGETPAKQLTVFTPGGIEDYFDDLTKVLTAVDDQARDVASALMERHDMVVPADSRPTYGRLAPSECSAIKVSD